MRLLGFLIRSKQGPGFSRILSELVQGSDVQLSTVFNIAEGASGLELLPQALGSFFLKACTNLGLCRALCAVLALPSTLLAVETQIV